MRERKGGSRKREGNEICGQECTLEQENNMIDDKKGSNEARERNCIK